MNQNKEKLALPTKEHIIWADCEIGAIIHCDIEICQPEWNFITNNKINPPPDPNVFNPLNLDTDQWIKSIKDAGAKYAVLTAKHVTGFILFPDNEYDYSIADTPFQGGKGDIIKDFIESCKRYDIKPGIYYSVEANAHLGIHKGSGNLPKYPSKEWDYFKEVVTRHLTILWSRYGDLFEIWFDGGVLENGPDYVGLLKKYQPNAVCFQGPKEHPSRLRWVGNERGLAPYPCWSTTGLGEHNFDGTEEIKELGSGDPNGETWIPAETDVPLRWMQWFWRENDDFKVAPAEEIVNWYNESVGRNSNLLIGVVIDKRGLVPDADVQSLREFGNELRKRYENSITEINGEGNEIEIILDSPTKINHIVIMEDIAKGHRIRKFSINCIHEGENEWRELYSGTAIGHKHIIQLSDHTVLKIRLNVIESVNKPIIRKLSLYYIEIEED